MLVLSRRLNEKVLLPSLGITLQILRVQGQTVRLGVDAPANIPIVRAELHDASAEPLPDHRSGKRNHALNNALNRITLSLHLARQELTQGEGQAGKLLDQAIEELEAFGTEWAASQAKAPVAKPVRRPRVLVVEDNSNEGQLLASLLSLKGCDCAVARDGLEALEYLATNPAPDFVLLDMRLPRCDGPETLCRIRSDPRFAGLKVFAVTGTPPHELNIPSGAKGVDAWFPKPLNPGRLWEAIQQNQQSPAVQN